MSQSILRSQPDFETLDRSQIRELIATIAHEMRNPLTTILLGLTRCQKASLPSADQVRIELALAEAERLQTLINDLLKYSCTSELKLCDLELNQFASKMLALLSSIPETANQVIHLMPHPCPVWIQGDRHKLTQVLMNLLTNACEATRITEAITWQISTDFDQQMAVIKIHNWGDPIPPQLLPLITKPFFTTKPQGHGLGLHLARKIVEAHGGSLLLESTAELGTTAEVCLPLSQFCSASLKPTP
jgi:signal transduction histidine kinase